jgi:Na+/phosphate symporter
MTSNVENYIGLLIQVPLVGIFVWFALSLIKQFNESMNKRDEAWREFLKEITNSTNAAIARIAEEVKGLGREISEMRGRNGQ